MKKKFLATIVAAGTVLSGCSGGGAAGGGGAGGGGGVNESSSATAVVGHLSGTAAVGAPLGLAKVKITCTGGGLKTGKTNSLGVYSIDVSTACTAPFHVKVSSSNGEVETIAVNSGAITNVTPLTQLIARRAVGNADLVANLANVNTAKMQAAQDVIKEALKDYAVRVNASVSADAFLATDLVGGAFSANGAGIDKLLDLIKVEPDAGNAGDFKILVGVTPVAVSVDSTVAITPPTPTEINNAVSAATTASTQLDGVRAYTKSLTDAFKNGRPSEVVFNQMIDAGLVHQGKDRAAMYEDLDGSDVKGLQFRNVVILDSTPSNFWVAFQIFGIENGSYSLWNTWTSKVDLNGNNGKGTLLGNRLPVGLYPGFVKNHLITGSNSVTSATTSFRVLEIGSVGNQHGIEFSKYNDLAITGGNVVISNGLVINTDQRLIDDLSAEFIVIHPNDAKKSITKITYSENSGSPQNAYIYVPQLGDEDEANYVTLTYPPFRAATGIGDNCRYEKSSPPAFSSFSLSHEDFDLAGLEMYFEHYQPSGAGVEGYPGFAAYSWDQLTATRFDAKIANYVTQNSSPNTVRDYLEIGKFDVGNYTINDVEYHSIYTCE